MTYEPPQEPGNPAYPPYTPGPPQTWPSQGQPYPPTTPYGQPAYQQQPYSQPPYPPPGPPPGPPRRRPRGPWYRRPGVLAAIGGAAVLVIIASALNTGGSKQTPAVQAVAATSAPVATAPPSPAATRPAAKPKPHTVATFSGSGIKNTAKFTVTSTWKLAYSFSCASFGQAGNFQVSTDGGGDFNGPEVNELTMRESSSTWAYDDAGTHYLEINSECDWTVKVIDEP